MFVNPQIQLNPGDVLLSQGFGWPSRAIGAFDGGRYSHAALVVETPSDVQQGDPSRWERTIIVESTTPTVARYPLSESLRQHPRQHIDAYRHKTLRAEQRAGIVAAAQKYVNSDYSSEDLCLLALVLITTSWMPNTATQEGALLMACGLNQLSLRDKTKDGKLVICTELVARAFVEAGVSLHVVPTPGQRFDREGVKALFMGLGELWREMRRTRSVDDPENQWYATQQRLRAEYKALMGVDPLRASRALGALLVGEEWGPNLVTPSYLEKSPDLALLGRIYQAPEEQAPARDPERAPI